MTKRSSNTHLSPVGGYTNRVLQSSRAATAKVTLISKADFPARFLQAHSLDFSRWDNFDLLSERSVDHYVEHEAQKEGIDEVGPILDI